MFCHCLLEEDGTFLKKKCLQLFALLLKNLILKLLFEDGIPIVVRNNNFTTDALILIQDFHALPKTVAWSLIEKLSLSYKQCL